MNKSILNFSGLLLGGFLLFSYAGLAQSNTVQGSIVDGYTGDALAGVNVIVKGSTTGTVSDLDGQFRLTVAELPTTLVFSFIGYTAIERTADGSESLYVEMTEDALDLDEVVVTGLASSVKRSNLANAVSTIDAEELTGITSQPTLDGALYGKLTGVNVVSTSGAPGGGLALRLRGISSITGNNQPLYIIDGVYISNAEIPSGLRAASGANAANEENASNRLADLDPNDIESIEVLKGASAAAIYGNRANAGVVIITTKRGQEGRTSVNFAQDVGINTIQKFVGRRSYNAAQVEEAFGEAALEPYNETIAREGGLYDYEEEIYGNDGLIWQSRIGISGGSDKTQFFIGGSIRDEEGIVENTGFERRSIRLNLDHQITDNITIRSSSNFVNSEAARSFTGNENEGGLSYGYTLAFTRDWVDLYPDEFGNYPSNPNAAGNPLLVRDLARNDETNNRFIQGLGLDINLFSTDKMDLQLRFNGGIDFLANQTDVYVPEFQQAQRASGSNGFIALGKNEIFNVNYQAFAVWNNYLGADKNITLSTQAGISYLNFDTDLVQTRTSQLIPGQTNASQGGSQEVLQTIETVEEFGYILQQEFNWEDKVILNGGVRLDKSSLNGDPNELFAFPRASVAVNVANFDFFNSNLFSLVKPRFAYGEAGSSADFGSLFTIFNRVNIEGSAGISIDSELGTPNLTPETSRELETGIDLALLNNRLGFTATYYNRSVQNLLFPLQIPASSGFTTRFVNDIDLANRGLELSLTARPVETSNFSWESTTNYWFNRSEITRLDVPEGAIDDTGFGLGLGSFYLREGEPITQFYGNGESGPQAIGDAQPDFEISFLNRFNILKRFDLMTLLHVKQGGNNLNLTRLLTDIGGTTPRDIPPPGEGEFYVEDASYFRVREIALYYSLPQPVFFGGAVSTWKIGVSARNPITITNYSSYDPEVSTFGGQGLSSGVEVAPFPSSRQFYAHFMINF
jgi:TonB-linked SusC/RagA family outer membrane protein